MDGPKATVRNLCQPLTFLAHKFDRNNELYAIKILTAHETLQYPSHELHALVAAKNAYINLYDHFTETSVHGSHLCLVTDIVGQSYEHLRLSSPTKSLPRHVVQRAIACMTEEIGKVHKSGLTHGGSYL